MRATGSKKIGKLFGETAYSEATQQNYEGAPTFARSDEERLILVLTTGTFEPTFYASDAKLAEEAVALFRQFAAADPHFLAQAIVYARTEGLLRLAPITALVVLSASSSDDAKEMFRRIFPKVIQTPGDLQDFVTLCRQKTLRGMGKAVTRAVGRWLGEMSEYHAIKYGAESQQMSLRDLYRLARPKLTGKADAIAHYLVKGEIADASLTPQIAGYEAFKAKARELKEDPRSKRQVELLGLVAEHRLPWEVVTAQVPNNTAAWRAMRPQLPYMALLRNLNNLVKSEALDKPRELAAVVKMLRDSKRVASSKQLPFRFLSAIKALQRSGDTAVVQALRAALDDALELSFANMPELGARVLIANDVSGSMSSKPSAKSDMTMAEIAGIFAAAAYKKAEHGTIVSFDTEAHPREVSKETSVSAIARAISDYGGGTSLSVPIEWAFGEHLTKKGGDGEPIPFYDVAIFLTDSESWVDHLTSNRGVVDLIREYKRRVNPALKCFFVQLEPYQHAVAAPDEPDCYYLYGWSASLLPFIAQMARGGQSQLDAVKQASVL